MKSNFLLRLKSVLLLPMLFLLLMAMSMVGMTQTVTIFTDQDDYWPGEWVVITGDGWTGEDSVKISLEHIEPNIPAHTHSPWYLKPDANGRIYDEWFVEDQELGTTFHLMALGVPTGRYAENWFTDGSGLTIPVVSQSGPIYSGAGGTITYSTNAARDNANNSFTATLSATGLPTGVTASFSPSSLNYVGGTPPQSFTLTLTIANTVTTQTYPFSINENSGFNLVVSGCTNPQVSSFVSATGNTSICAGDQGQLTMTTSSGTGPFTVIYNNGTSDVTVEEVVSGTPFGVIPSPTSGTTTYILKSVTDANGCSRTSGFTDGTASISVRQLPTATITGTATVCQNATSPNIIFTGTAPGGTIPPYTFTYKINDGPEQTITTTSGSSVTLSAPTNTAGVFTYSLVSVAFASSPNCTNTASGNAVVTVQPVPTLSINDVTVNEGAGTAEFMVTLSAPVVCDVTFDVATADNTATAGSDYTAITTTSQTILAGATTKTISVPILNGDIAEATERFFVNLSNPVNATISNAQGIGTIADDDAYTLSIADEAAITEGDVDANHNFTVTMSGVAQSAVVVSFTTTNGTAVGTDFTAQTAVEYTIPAGSTSVTIPVQILGDEIAEATEIFTGAIALVNVNGQQITIADGTTTGTIADDDAYTVSLAGFIVTETNGVQTQNFVATMTGKAQENILLTFNTTVGTAGTSDFTTVTSYTATILAGYRTVNIPVDILGDQITEPQEAFTGTIVLANANGQQITVPNAGKTATSTINDNDASSVAIDDVTVDESAGTAVFTVTLTGAIQDNLTVDYLTSDVTAAATSDYTLTSGTLTFLAGAVSGTQLTITVPILDGAVTEPTETYNVNLSNVVSTGVATISDNLGVGTITDNDKASLSISDVTVLESAGTATLTVTLTGTVQNNFTIGYSTANNSAVTPDDYSAKTGTLTFGGSNSNTKTIVFAIANDAGFEPTESFFVNLINLQPAGQDITITDVQGEITITDNDVNITIDKPTSTTGQYSDVIELQATLLNGSGVGLEGQTITFKVGIQTVTATTNSAGVAYTTLKLNQDPNTTTTDNVRATFAGNTVDGIPYETKVVEKAFDVVKENAIVDYTGPEFVGESNPNLSSTPVLLNASIIDSPDSAGNEGDIRNTRVMFYDVNTTIPISGWLTPGLVTPGDYTKGIVTFNWNVPVPTSGYNTFTIGVMIEGTGYYVGGPTQSVLNVYRTTLNEFITGGGHIIPMDSKGEYASDPGKKVNFGYNVKWNKSLKNLQGNLNLIFRRGDQVYQIKTNATENLSVNTMNPCSQQATFTSKANLTNVTNSAMPVSVYGGLSLSVTMTDNGEPGVADMIGFTLYNGSTLIYSSSWPVNKTVELPLVGGNNVVHNGTICNASTATTTAITSTKNPSVVGDMVTFKATVTESLTADPEGTITFKIDGANPGTTVPMVGGSASWSTDELTQGSRSITAVYTSTNGFDISTGILIQVVNTTSVALTSSLNPSVIGNNVTLSATVIAGIDGKTVSFKDGVTEIGSSTVSGGIATFTTNLLTVGSHNITAVYDGTVPSPILVQVVNGSISVALTSSKNPSNTGELVVLTATVSGATTGTVTFKDGSATIETANISGGAATLNYTFSTAGTHSLTAVYGTTTSAAYAQVVNSTTAVILSSSVNPSNQSQSVKFTATVNGVTGSVKFYDGTTLLTPVPVNLTGGVATYTTSALSLGSHVIKAQYYNTSNELVSEASLTQVVTTLSIALTSSRNPAPTRTNITFTATVTGTGGFIPSGIVTFKNGTTTLGTATMSNGKATLTKSFTSAADLSITAVYNVTGLTSTVLLQKITSTKSASITTDVAEVIVEPTLKAYPNPFTEKLNIEFSSATDAQAKLEIYSITGAKLETLFNGPVYGGLLYNFEYLPRLVSSQMVLYHLTIDGKTQVGKVIYNERR